MLSDKKGLAMLMVISLILMLLILGGAALMISTGHFGTSYHQIKRARAYYAAEAGMQHALWACRTGEYDLSSIPPPINRPDEINVNGLDVDIRIELMGTAGAPAGTYPIRVRVNY